ncbi:replication protein, partial [Gallibacterium anatis]|uniref:replication protein n=1 Tax=Gallibacterium anatis TaxID=750 RepID=UPI00057FA6AF
MSNFIPNSFQIPNAIIDNFLAKLSGNAFKCYALIARQTTGWQKQSDKISVAQFMSKCGIKDRKTAMKCLEELEEINLIITFKKCGEITEFSLNLNPEIPEPGLVP